MLMTTIYYEQFRDNFVAIVFILTADCLHWEFFVCKQKILQRDEKMISMCVQKLLVHPINVGYLIKRGLKQTLSLCSRT